MFRSLSMDVVEPTGITMQKTLSLKVSVSKTLVATVEPEGASVSLTWTSSKPEVVTVDDAGNVFGVITGTTNIKASYGDLSASTYVTVS